MLVVDDNATNREILAAYLRARRDARDEADERRRRRCRMLEAAAARGEPYELVVLDARCPRWTALELARAIRAGAVLRARRLVMLTSTGDRAAAREARTSTAT